MTDVAQDVSFMQIALRLARKGGGQTSPNPMVGAVLVKDGHVIGKGYHRQAGGPHAEISALHQAGPKARGSTLYVTLEPCCHTRKRTPPCVPALIHSHLRRVVVAMRDPNPQVSGQGIQQLRRAGIRVEVDCMENEATQLNEFYVHWITTGRPYLILKAAMTLDGKIATAGGASKWITGKEARRHVHELRAQVDAIMVGIGTVLQDDPQLSVRLSSDSMRRSNVRQPVRVILDSRLRIPLSAHVLRWPVEQPTIVATTIQASKTKIQQLRDRGVAVLIFPINKGHVSLSSCLNRLGKMGVTSVLLEGGSALNASAFQEKFVNRVMLYIAPQFLGGQSSRSLIGGPSPLRLTAAIQAKSLKIQNLGQDFLITAYPGYPNKR